MTRPARSSNAAARSASTLPRCDARTPAAQSTVWVAMRSSRPLTETVTPSASMFVTRALVRERTPREINWRSALTERSGGKVGRTRGSPSTSMMAASRGSMWRKSWRRGAVAISPSAPARLALDEHDGGLARVDVAEVVAQGVVGDLAERAGQFDAGGAAAHDDEVQPGAARGGIRLALGALESEEEAAADRGGVFDGFEARRDGFPLVVAEVVVSGSGGNDQGVVGDCAIAQDDAAVGHIEVDGFAEEHFGVAIVLEHDTQGGGNFAGREPAGGHLVEQGLEEVEVAAIDQCDRYGRAAEGLGDIQPAESAADDHHAMRWSSVGLHWVLDACGRECDAFGQARCDSVSCTGIQPRFCFILPIRTHGAKS